MSDFPDIERFAREHTGCGGLTPNATPRPGGGGYLLTISCACGASLDRWVSREDARHPLPIPMRAAPAAPRPPSPPAPAAPASASVAGASKPTPRPSEDLEALVREALVAEDGASAPPPPPARTRPAPARLNLDTTIRSALQQQAELTLPPPRRASRGGAVWLALFVIVGLGAAGAIYMAGGPGTPAPVVPGGTAAPRPAESQRAALESVVKALRELHAVATSTTTVSVYEARVEAVKIEAERFLAASPPGSNRTRVREVLDIHLLAVNAWRAKSLDQREAWEAVGLDPSVDLCPPLRLVADFAVQAEKGSRAQARGAAVASALPLLWECANERIAALEQGLATR